MDRLIKKNDWIKIGILVTSLAAGAYSASGPITPGTGNSQSGSGNKSTISNGNNQKSTVPPTTPPEVNVDTFKSAPGPALTPNNGSAVSPGNTIPNNGSVFTNGETSGMVQSVDVGNGVSRIRIKDIKGQTSEFTIDKNISIFKKDEKTSLSDIEPGDNVTLRLQNR